MAQFFSDGGPWMLIILVTGLGALALNVVQLTGRSRRDLGPAVTGTIAATVLAGVCATSVGLVQAGLVLPGLVEAGKVDAFSTAVQAVQISLNPTVLASLLSAVNALLWGVARTLRARPA